jgi:hypothetical protein
MADKKISALTPASTPLAGTEVLPIVQSGTTVKTTVLDVTTAIAIAPSSVKTSSGSDFSQFGQVNGRVVLYATNAPSSGATSNQWRFALREIADGDWALQHWNGTSYDERITLGAAGDFTNRAGNFVPATAAKGINFTANTPAAGMTSQLLNWYEEGTWTPAQGAGLTLVGAFSSTGKYTRIGRSVTISGTVTGATSVAVTAAGVITSNLPFTAGTAGHGSATNEANTAFASVICTTTNVTSAGAIAATATITFSATYFV